MSEARARRLRPCACFAVLLAAAAARLSAQAVLDDDSRAVADLDAYRRLDWMTVSAPPTEMPAEGSRPLLLLADSLDLRGGDIRFAGDVPPRQAAFVAREMVLGEEARITIRGRPLHNALPPGAASDTGPASGGLLVLIADTLRIDSLPALHADVRAEPLVEDTTDGGLVVAFRRLSLAARVARELCRPMLEIADLVPAGPDGRVRLDPLDRELLARRFDPRNPIARPIRDEPETPYDRESLRRAVEEACRWDVDEAPATVVAHLLAIDTSADLLGVPDSERRRHEADRTAVVTDFGRLAELAPVSRILTLWSIAYFEHLGRLLAAAAARQDQAGIDAALARFETAPDLSPDPALAARWREARDPLRYALAYHKPASPGRRLLSRLPPNVVLLEAVPEAGKEAPEPGCGFVVGRSGDGREVYLVTAGHVVAGAAAVTLTFWSDDPQPRQLAERDARIVEPIGELGWDLALLASPVPEGWSWRPEVQGDPAKLTVQTPVWSMSVASGAVLPSLDTGVVRVPAVEAEIEAEGLESWRGNSGCPLVSDTGIVGLILGREASGRVSAMPIGLIRSDVLAHWGIPWGLEPAATEGPAR